MLKLTNSSGKPNFLRIAFEEYLYAMLEDRHLDSDYVKMKSYKRYEEELYGMDTRRSQPDGESQSEVS